MRNVIVTGASRGLGLGIARQLVTAGYRVIAIARQEGAELTETIHATGGDALHFVPFDLNDVADIPRMVKGLRQRFGTIHGLVNNAGIGTNGPLGLMPDRQIEELLRLNVLSPVILTKYVARTMMASQGGRIVNIASVAGFAGFSGLSVYGASKAALLGFTRSLAREIGPLGINVNAVAPGFVQTDMTHGMRDDQRDQVIRRSALRRLADVEDVAGAVEYLLGDQAKNITGTVLTVDGGSTA